MPEADAVERTTRALDALAGQVLTGCDLRWPSLAAHDLTGRLVIGTARVGKHLLTRFEADGNRPAVTLHSHLRMEGSWRVHAAGQGPPPRRHTVRAVLGTAAWVAVGDRLGMLDLVRTDAEAAVVGHLGPDILGPAFDAGTVLAAVTAHPEPVGQALLDQRVVAGLGTIWVSEALHAGRLNPWTPGPQVPPNQLVDALTSARTRLTQTLAGRRDVPAVYGRRHQPCRRCRTPIRRDPIGPPLRRRDLFWCPRCQPT